MPLLINRLLSVGLLLVLLLHIGSCHSRTSLESAVHSLSKDVSEVDAKAKETDSHLKLLEERREKKSRVRETMANASESVFLIGAEPSGPASFVPLATAFAIPDGWLVTAAHVAIDLMARRAAGERIVVRRATDPTGEEELEVGDIRSHQTFREFQRWLSFLNEYQVTGQGIAMPPADLALLEVPGAGPALRIARDPDMSPGTELVLSGFLLENIIGLPTLHQCSGRVVARTRVDFTPAAGADWQILLHDALATGGISGAPVIDATTGEVVAVQSAGAIVSVEGSRVVWGLNMATRLADRIDEVISGRRCPQDAAWRRLILRRLPSPARMAEVVLSQVLDGATFTPIHTQTVTLSGLRGDATVDLPRRGTYVVVAASEDFSDLDAEFRAAGHSTSDAMADPYPVCQLSVTGPTRARVRLNAPSTWTPDPECTVMVVRVDGS